MKRLSTVLIIIIVVLSFFSGYFLYQISDLEREKSDLQNRNSELENQIDELQSVIDKHTELVNITEFTVYGWMPLVCLTIGSHANITIENNGINNVTDLVLTLECPTVNFSRSWTIEIIHPREEIQIKEYVTWNLDSSPTWVATISKGDKILDKRTIWDYEILDKSTIWD
jgi:predicted phage-related endonuclease